MAVKNRILRIKEVAEVIGLSESAVRKKIANCDDFPVPIRLGARAIGIRSEELEAWIEERQSPEYRSML
jgi:prophage regulatory protein